MIGKVKRNTKPCWCPAYNFPHRAGGGKCEMPIWCGEDSNDPNDCLIPIEYDVCEFHEGFLIEETWFTHPSLTAWERNK